MRQTLTMPLARHDLISLLGRACDLGNGALFVGTAVRWPGSIGKASTLDTDHTQSA